MATRLAEAGLFWPWAFYYYETLPEWGAGVLVQFDETSHKKQIIQAPTACEFLAWMPPYLHVGREMLRKKFPSYVPIGKKIKRWSLSEFELFKTGANSYTAAYNYRGVPIAIPDTSEPCGYMPLIAHSCHLPDCLAGLALSLLRFGLYKFPDWSGEYFVDPSQAYERTSLGPDGGWRSPSLHPAPIVDDEINIRGKEAD